jgi:hypothetical protein
MKMTKSEAGQKGGTTRTENTKKKGFGSNPDLARIAGYKGKATRYGKSLDDFKLGYELAPKRDLFKMRKIEK